ncbi:bifunctional phosphopantothenoylcysteine decarboxylase/phosphopantothenate--cysteine ligase CoaBC [Terriglobus saanensis]|uniref:Coenzyme A biosynthesis bifunctional protein CoaBC n=1 Tax=Terriglobus saanensis (strain ATCC BAA-1853 / DSM 23119 / SP1PR4) TaxID=401053 RepID=E8UZX9_TERSS|nr:bifunctional phosphopantothenoylcysteine decarboxylase/phosphopantothenate--cysteine ligase CoaBC [Terriglobus saanensis]ADV81056.1 phosphopantothenoylcysteine decarboxylase/phosphopantothenate/cysteine ligase [Terriglobus saanensis SP1PR4]
MNILLAVTGGIAAYKAAELTRELQRRLISVQVVMTPSAEEFVRPLTFAALTGKQVLTSLWQPAVEGSDEFSIEHIAVAHSIDALVVAPATADSLAKMAHGIADNLFLNIFLATKAPVIVAPAMNVNMWEHPATQANLQLLRRRGVLIVEPDAGYLACGMIGGGRLAEVTHIADEVTRLLTVKSDLSTETVLITAGGTQEPIDPVRYIGNRSSGKMGHALAQAAMDRGARVILVTASGESAPATSEVIRVRTAEEMRRAVLDRLPDATVVIKAAAVSDYRVSDPSSQKVKRSGALTLQLEPTGDIAHAVAAQRQPGTLVIAFAAETEDLLTRARRKLVEKNVDAIVANDVSQPGIGFDAEDNAGFFLTPYEEIPLSRSSKREMAHRILDELLRLRTHQKTDRSEAGGNLAATESH